ncbi:MAG: DUF2934 domain-containing protein [Gammaproteobacteria bacterium]|nr:DUF2934 domain-containing protein [Gammaproteobacteria bacterium]
MVTKFYEETDEVQMITEELSELTESLVSPEEREEMIAEAAYYRAQQRGFAPEGKEQDWLEAEKVVDEMLIEAVKEEQY